MRCGVVWFGLAALGLLLVASSGCKPTLRPSGASNGSTNELATFAGQHPVKIVATTGMVADLVRQVGGDHVQVTQLIGSGIDPHLYRPTSDDVREIMAADMVFYSGLMLEGKMGDALVKTARSKPVVAVTESVDPSVLLEPEGEAGHDDPHLWNDVSTWSSCVEVVSDSLSKFDPVHQADFASDAKALRLKLDELHQYGIEVLATIPEKRRILITSHDAFNYFGRAYGLQVLGVQGISTESEAGIQRINALVDLLVDNDVRAVFTESSVPQKSIDALVEGARSRGHDVKVGGSLFSDAMGMNGTYEGTYVGMLDHNITVVARALGGQADAGGFQGKLTSGQVTSDSDSSP